MKKKPVDWSSWTLLIPLALGAFILIHSIGLTKLPIFADEAIYLRWAQLTLSEPGRYAFFPLNDGKTPLFTWAVIPLLLTKIDPLLAGRLFSLIAGVVQIIILGLLAKKLKFGKLGVLSVFVFITLAPFWFFHHRMALMDAWLTTLISATTLSLLTLYENKEKKWFVISAVLFGLAMFTKIPAILAAPALVLTPFLVMRFKAAVRWSGITALILGAGVVLAGLVLLHPAGHQLFSRGGDFLHPISDILAGKWRETIPNGSMYLGYFWQYLTPGIMILALVPLLFERTRRLGIVFLLQFLLFVGPIWLMGKYVYPRYLFPASIWLTLAATLGLVTLVYWGRSAKREAWQKLFAGVLLTGTVLVLCLNSLQFMLPAWTNPDKLPLVQRDINQYLGEWSSGHGTQETYQLMRAWSRLHPEGELLVVTEGMFGTLPDSLILYNYNRPLPNVRIEGAEIIEFRQVPPRLYDLIQQKNYSDAWLVVNKSRLFMELPSDQLLGEYCRPAATDCLQVWDISDALSEVASSK